MLQCSTEKGSELGPEKDPLDLVARSMLLTLMGEISEISGDRNILRGAVEWETGRGE